MDAGKRYVAIDATVAELVTIRCGAAPEARAF